MAKVFRENTDKINAIDFSPTGEHLISCSEDDQIVIYDCDKGTQTRTVNSKKYGVDLIHFTHNTNTAIHSSTKVDDTIRYLSLHDNKYLRYFPGHTKKVISLCISPIEDSFLSGSLDKTLRLWDLRSPNCQGVMHLSGRPIAAYDPEGLIFAAGVNSESIKLYDLRSFDKGPFVTFKLNQEKECDWTGLKFSKDGKTILISTNGSIIRLVDAFHGTPLQTFTGEEIFFFFFSFFLYKYLSFFFLLFSWFNRSSEQQRVGHRIIVQSRLSVYFLRQYRWTSACLECRHWLQSVRLEWRSSWTNPMRSIQPEIYDACIRMHKYGILVANTRRRLRRL